MVLKGVDISTIQKNHGRSSVQKAEKNVQHESCITCNSHKQDHNNETEFEVKEICFEYIRPHVASIQKRNSSISLRCAIIMVLKGVDISTIQKNHGRSSVQKAEKNVQHESCITCNSHKQEHNNEAEFEVKEICFEKEYQDIEKSRTSKEICFEKECQDIEKSRTSKEIYLEG